jgi:hypothetical protein
MTKEKIVNLTTYLNNMINKLNSPIPDKHKNHSDSYRQFLTREIKTVKDKLEAAKLGASGK